MKQWKRVFTSKGDFVTFNYLLSCISLHNLYEFFFLVDDVGVFSEKLQLSDQPVLGDWNITVFVSVRNY